MNGYKLLLKPETREAFKNISSLIKRLMEPSRARTQWMQPSAKQKRSKQEVNICNALSENFAHNGHGAASALRLYNDFMPKVNRMAAEKQHLLKQSVLLSCCSMPFHDHHFREYMRTMCGSCIISTDVMPFAGLLAFIDSIQDDRRDLSGLLEEIYFLDKILISKPANVQADVNHNAIPKASFLWKIIEARDVYSSLSQQTNQLTFIYPTWMVA